jgi:hypothetical protein
VKAYASKAIKVLNQCAVGSSSATIRDVLTMVAALATATYSFWTPTIKTTGFEGMSHLQVKERLSSTAWASWWDVRDCAPVVIGKTGGPRSVRTPLHQFLLHMRLRSIDPRVSEERWQQIRHLSPNVVWSDLVCKETVTRQQFERWMRGAISIPQAFLDDEHLNPCCLDDLTNQDRLRFSTLRTIQLLWGLCAQQMPKHHDLLARVFAGLMEIPYVGRLVS